MTEEDRKVVGLFNRQPFIPPTPEPMDDGEVRVDEAAVRLLEETLERMKSGESYGCIVIAGIADQDGMVAFASVGCTSAVWESEQVFIGGCNQAAYDIMHISDMEMMSEIAGD